MATAANFVTVDEFLEMERASKVKHEYYQGEVREMPGASLSHVRIVGNLFLQIQVLLRAMESPCEALHSDMKIRTPDDFYSYPDVSVVCRDARFEGEDRDLCADPTVIVEVLSPSAEAFDRGEKFRRYEKIDALRAYLLVSQDRPQLELFERSAATERWQLSRVERIESTCTIASLGIAINMAEIYRGVEFTS